MAEIWATRWLLVIFFDLPFPVVLRIWDYFLHQGYSAVYSIVIAILMLLESKMAIVLVSSFFNFFPSSLCEFRLILSLLFVHPR